MTFSLWLLGVLLVAFLLGYHGEEADEYRPEMFVLLCLAWPMLLVALALHALNALGYAAGAGRES